MLRSAALVLSAVVLNLGLAACASDESANEHAVDLGVWAVDWR